MADRSGIEWTEATWNPTTGCTKVSEGCRNCYAERMARRLKAMGRPEYRNGFSVTTHADRLAIPGHWKRPRMVFVDSMGDPFHEDVPIEFIRQVFDAMQCCPQHTFQILTKRSSRLAEVFNEFYWRSNVWIGVSVENADNLYRVDDLRQVNAWTRFVSCEPLLGPLELNLTGIHWVIVGGESGPGARPMRPEWVRSIRDQCSRTGVPFFFKQWGGVNKKSAGRELDGVLHDGVPRTWLLPPMREAARVGREQEERNVQTI